MDSITSKIPASAQSMWLAGLSALMPTPKVIGLSVLAVVAGGSMAYFGKLPMIGADTVLQTQVAGLADWVQAYGIRLQTVEKTTASKADIAEIRARLDALEVKAKTAPLTTGSIGKPVRK